MKDIKTEHGKIKIRGDSIHVTISRGLEGIDKDSNNVRPIVFSINTKTKKIIADDYSKQFVFAMLCVPVYSQIEGWNEGMTTNSINLAIDNMLAIKATVFELDYFFKEVAKDIQLEEIAQIFKVFAEEGVQVGEEQQNRIVAPTAEEMKNIDNKNINNGHINL